MAQIVRPAGVVTRKNIVGRGNGSGIGRSSRRGHDGQNSRSGGGVRLGFEGGQMPLYRRIARRGFSNCPFKVEHQAISLSVLDSVFADGETVSDETLRQKGLIKGTDTAKILADGEITKHLVIEGVKASASAQEKIKAAGGEIR